MTVVADILGVYGGISGGEIGRQVFQGPHPFADMHSQVATPGFTRRRPGILIGSGDAGALLQTLEALVASGELREQDGRNGVGLGGVER